MNIWGWRIAVGLLAAAAVAQLAIIHGRRTVPLEVGSDLSSLIEPQNPKASLAGDSCATVFVIGTRCSASWQMVSRLPTDAGIILLSAGSDSATAALLSEAGRNFPVIRFRGSDNRPENETLAMHGVTMLPIRLTVDRDLLIKDISLSQSVPTPEELTRICSNLPHGSSAPIDSDAAL